MIVAVLSFVGMLHSTVIGITASVGAGLVNLPFAVFEKSIIALAKKINGDK